MTPTITNNESVILHKFPFRHRFAEIDCTKMRQSPSHFVMHSKTNTQITYLSHKNMSKNTGKIVEKSLGKTYKNAKYKQREKKK